MKDKITNNKKIKALKDKRKKVSSKFYPERAKFIVFLVGIIFCSGIFVFCFMLINNPLAPNNPVSIGRRGWLRFRFKEAIPRKPERRKIIKVQSFLSFSVKIM